MSTTSRSSVTSSVKMLASSTTIEEKMAEEEQERIRKLEETVRQLLDLCARNEVNVPEDIATNVLFNLGGSVRTSGDASHVSHQDFLLSHVSLKVRFEDLDLENQYRELMRKLKSSLPDFEIQVKDGSYTIIDVHAPSAKPNHSMESSETGPRRARQKIATVGTTNPCYAVYRLLKQCIVHRGRVPLIREEKKLMDNVNLVLESGKMYLVLGGPGSGKSTLLKYIANTHFIDKKHKLGGELKIGSLSPGKGVYWTKLVAYIDQIDRLHALLTVFETCNFAWKCRSGGTHRKAHYSDDAEADETIQMMDEMGFAVNGILQMMGLERVKDTFVGDQISVRGVSGGEKKRVTCSEMFCVGVPVLCCDEMSTGLDAATTYEITRALGNITHMTPTIRIVSLLQPPPETVANFDEIILLAEGRIIYAGPIDKIIAHFEALGYEIPERMDLADWLQALPTKDGWMFLKGASETGATKEDFVSKHLNAVGFHERFYSSALGQAILEKLNSPAKGAGNDTLAGMVKVKYANPWYKSMKLLVNRELTLWWRNKVRWILLIFYESAHSNPKSQFQVLCTAQYALKAKIIQTLFMGTVIGTVFFQSTGNPSNVMSVLFQSMFYMVISAMVLIVRSFPARSIFYKQQDAHFYPTWAYVLGRSLSTVPVALIDAIGYGSMIFWLVGLAYNDGASIANYFMFMLLLFITSLSAGLLFGVLAALVSVISQAQACMAFVAVVLVLFSGFTVTPNVIPPYYIWLYWLNFAAWLLRGFVLNEYASGKYDEPSPAIPELTIGEAVLTQYGFTRDGIPFTFVWAWYGALFSIGAALVTMVATTVFYTRIRFATGKSLVTDKGSDEVDDLEEEQKVEIPFKRVDLTFEDIRYTVQASTTKEKLELLKGIDGIVKSGQMTALMGSSGAGKTTLMDVLSLRKNTGEVQGVVRLNGHIQEEKSFRRAAGYVEQFDTQTPQLTIKETLLFSAKLRLEESDPAVTDESIQKFVYQTMHMLELVNVQDLQVGTDETGGLSFEQKKRLSIAVELVANPSIIFLDEPTSGLDARAAAVVMRGLKRIASSGRAVCATIHQPSIAIFNDFDVLLLLKRGGEVVYHGELGNESCKLIQYFERFEATPRIQPGENPATWMLTTIGAGTTVDSNKKPFDYVGSYAASKLHAKCLDEIKRITEAATLENKIIFSSTHATSKWTQSMAVLRRTMKVYYRSPSYNTTRSILSSILALLYATVYVSQRVPKTEADMTSRINSIFMAVIFLCISAQNTVLGVFETERNMFYRHKAANMYDSGSLLLAFTVAEIPFIFMASLLFCVLFYFAMGFALDAAKFFLFFLFVTLGMGTYTFLGQMLMSLFKDAQTAQSIGALISTSTSLFSGVFIRPSEIPNFWIFMYWLMPGHWIFEGIFMSQFDGNDTMITASPGSIFFDALGCSAGEICEGTVWEWVQVNFTNFSPESIKWDALYLIGMILLTRVIAFYALTTMNHLSN